MDLGFETIGNATLICHDGGPLLATDPWLQGSAYFGSWALSHAIPEQQLEAIRQARFLWVSHGHPDHLSPESLATLKHIPVLLPDHVGARIADGLREDGHQVRVLPDGEWTELSPRVRVASVSDYNQDAVLLVEMDGHLIANTNDASDRGGSAFLREALARTKRSWLLALTGWGDADMIHFFDEQGGMIPPTAASKEPLGPGIAGLLDFYDIETYVPFSTMHRYQRTDSAWANEFAVDVQDFPSELPSPGRQITPAYVRVDLLRDSVEAIDPPRASQELLEPEAFGDNWSDELEPEDERALRAYFEPLEHLRTFLGWVRFRVGGKELQLDIEPAHAARGITFEVPRHSLMEAIRWRVFEDLLIGNFMRTTLHGPWHHKGDQGLHPDFSPYVGKYADNGGARSAVELKRYFAEYHGRGFFGAGPRPGEQDLLRSISRYAPEGG